MGSGGGFGRVEDTEGIEGELFVKVGVDVEKEEEGKEEGVEIDLDRSGWA